MNPGTQLRLDAVDKLLDSEVLAGVWQRSAVWLIRLALEHELDDLWRRCNPAVCDCRRMRSKLLALGIVTDRTTQYRVTTLWSALSRAAHHHHYELAPTAAELRSWLDEARTLCSCLATHT